LENTEGAIKNGQSRETGNKEKQNKNTTQCVGHHYTQANTNNVNKTWGHPTNNWRRTEHRFYTEIVTDVTTWNSRHIIGQHKKLDHQDKE